MHFKVWKSPKNKEWYWTLIATNGQKIATSGEGYKNKADCLTTLGHIKAGAAAAPIEEAPAEAEKPPKAAKASKPAKAPKAAKPPKSAKADKPKAAAKPKPAAKPGASPKA